jgi:hypothetical protein
MIVSAFERGMIVSAFERGMIVSAFERGMIVSARRSDLCQELQPCWVCHTKFPVCINNGPLHKWHKANLTPMCPTVVNIPVERFWHIVESLPRQIEAVLRAKGGATQY